jgi:hypothetical protein
VPRRPPLRLALLGLALVTGCTTQGAAPQDDSPVDVEVPVVDAATAATCARLFEALPDEVDPGVTRRPVRGDETLTAAWGDPPVTLTCGVPEPDRPEEPVVINGVAWSVRDIGAGFRWTTRSRAVHVAVDIPSRYENGAEIVNPLSGPVASAVPTTAPQQ